MPRTAANRFIVPYVRPEDKPSTQGLGPDTAPASRRAAAPVPATCLGRPKSNRVREQVEPFRPAPANSRNASPGKHPVHMVYSASWESPDLVSSCRASFPKKRGGTVEPLSQMTCRQHRLHMG